MAALEQPFYLTKPVRATALMASHATKAKITNKPPITMEACSQVSADHDDWRDMLAKSSRKRDRRGQCARTGLFTTLIARNYSSQQVRRGSITNVVAEGQTQI